MKFFLTLILSFGLFASMQAQSTRLVTKSITGVDTVSFANVPSKINSFQYTFTRTSGTAAGVVVFEGTVNGTFVSIDTLVLSNVGTAQTKVFVIPRSTGTSYLTYRFRNTNTSAATGTVRAAYLRRTDE